MLQIYAVYDSAVKAYNNPLFFRSKGEALRSFMQACQQEDSQFRANATDYSLHYLGEYDPVSGDISSAVPERVISANECLTPRPTEI